VHVATITAMVGTHVLTTVSAKSHLTLRLTYHLTAIMLIFAPMLSSLPQMPTGMEPIIPKQIPSPLVQIRTLTHYLPYTIS